tara:strand:+ start:291 stop:575 length:285 start_codon:yes stop_codon:yes gene_type:complete
MDYQLLINIGFGVLSTIAGWLFKVLYDQMRLIEKEVNELEDSHEEDHREVVEKINQLALTLPEKYVNKNDFENLVKVVHHRFDRLEEKLDNLKG